ncbi:MAG TPA: hypothetical protein PKG90_00450 [Chitinophagaceae bacterium]|nr:hypothetical protein [Chitinophagaceae bacterium]HNU13141.1 hypothetical protein [Chitinophagaceae bacterium]
METKKHSSHSRPVLSQAQNNTTLWIGHLKPHSHDRLAGQTFICPSEGLVNNIQVYASAVTQPGEVALTLHEFDPSTNTWGPAIGNTSRPVDKNDGTHWIRFELEPIALKKDATYGFRLQTNDGIVGIGEAASGNKHPFTFGQAWNGYSSNDRGEFFRYFSLAFKVELCA